MAAVEQSDFKDKIENNKDDEGESHELSQEKTNKNIAVVYQCMLQCLACGPNTGMGSAGIPSTSPEECFSTLTASSELMSVTRLPF